MEVQVFWFSEKTKKEEMVYAKNLTLDQRNKLLSDIFNHGSWPELKTFIEKTEEGKISYICSGVRVSGLITRLNLIVKKVGGS